MKIFVDADACPVKKLIIDIASGYGIEVFLVHSTCHFTQSNKYKSISDQVSVIMVDNESQAADMKIINMSQKDDIVVTGDFGLASLVLGKGAYAISFNGKIYRTDSIDVMLLERHISASIRRSGGRIKGPPKRNIEDDINFSKNLNILIRRIRKDIWLRYRINIVYIKYT